MFCGDPGTPLNGRREDKLTVFLAGMTVNYYCDFTFQLMGPQNRTCLADGNWSNVLPSCKS